MCVYKSNNIYSFNKPYYTCNSRNFIKKKEVARNTKLNMYNVFRPVLAFECETWTLTNRERSKLQAAEMKYPEGSGASLKGTKSAIHK